VKRTIRNANEERGDEFLFGVDSDLIAARGGTVDGNDCLMVRGESLIEVELNVSRMEKVCVCLGGRSIDFSGD
jgi:hypothetical protein